MTSDRHQVAGVVQRIRRNDMNRYEVDTMPSILQVTITLLWSHLFSQFGAKQQPASAISLNFTLLHLSRIIYLQLISRTLIRCMTVWVCFPCTRTKKMCFWFDRESIGDESGMQQERWCHVWASWIGSALKIPMRCEIIRKTSIQKDASIALHSLDAQIASMSFSSATFTIEWTSSFAARSPLKCTANFSSTFHVSCAFNFVYSTINWTFSSFLSFLFLLP